MRKHACVKLDGGVVLADAAENGGFEIAVSRVLRLRFEQTIHFAERLARFHLPVQHDDVVVSCGVEVRCEFETPCQKAFRIPIPPDARRHFRQHADGGDARRLLF